MKIYTKTGDEGTTGLPGGRRVAKDDLRLETIGTIDELNCLLGVARAESLPDGVDRVLDRCQNELLAAGAELAAEDPARLPIERTGADQTKRLEDAIDRFEATLPALTQFILPAGNRAAAALHHARAVCRRAERRLVALDRDVAGGQYGALRVYLNRLADLLFVLARAANVQGGAEETLWKKRADR